MSKKEEKQYTAEEVARAVLQKAHEVLKSSKLAKANTAHEIEAGQEPKNDEAEAPEYLANADIENSDSGEKKKKKASGESEASEEGAEEESEENEYMDEDEGEDEEDDEEYFKSEKVSKMLKSYRARKNKSLAKSEDKVEKNGVEKVYEFLAKSYAKAETRMATPEEMKALEEAKEKGKKKDAKKAKLGKAMGQIGKLKPMAPAKPAGGGASVKPDMPKQPENIMKPQSNGTGMKGY